MLVLTRLQQEGTLLIDGQVTAGTLEQAAATVLNPGVDHTDAHEFEDGMEKHAQEWTRSFVEWCFNALKSEEGKRCRSKSSTLVGSTGDAKRRRPHTKVLTRFGNITLTRATDSQGSRGRTIVPPANILALECGATASV